MPLLPQLLPSHSNRPATLGFVTALLLPAIEQGHLRVGKVRLDHVWQSIARMVSSTQQLRQNRNPDVSDSCRNPLLITLAIRPKRLQRHGYRAGDRQKSSDESQRIHYRAKSAGRRASFTVVLPEKQINDFHDQSIPDEAYSYTAG